MTAAMAVGPRARPAPRCQKRLQSLCTIEGCFHRADAQQLALRLRKTCIHATPMSCESLLSLSAVSADGTNAAVQEVELASLPEKLDVVVAALHHGLRCKQTCGHQTNAHIRESDQPAASCALDRLTMCQPRGLAKEDGSPSLGPRCQHTHATIERFQWGLQSVLLYCSILVKHSQGHARTQ